MGRVDYFKKHPISGYSLRLFSEINMNFVHLKYLFFIWAVPVFAFFYFYGARQRKKILSDFASNQGLKAIIPGVQARRRYLKAILILTAVLLTAIALAGPRYGYKWQKIERKGIDIIIAIDCSRSMLATDISPTRLDRAKREVFDLLDMLKGDRIGLVAFAGTAFLQCPLTLDYSGFNLFLNALSPDFLPIGGSDLSTAIETAIGSFEPKAKSEKAIILITDGENTGRQDPKEAAAKARKAGIKLFCIGVGTNQGVPLPTQGKGFKKDLAGKIILSRLDEKTLEKIADLTGGVYVHSIAGDLDLNTIYTKEIRGKMKAATLSEGKQQVWEDRFQWPLALAFLLVIIELLLPSTKTASKSFMILLLFILLPTLSLAGPLQDGLTAYDQKNYEKALKLFIDAQLQNPDDPEILYNIGNAYYKIGEFNTARDHYQQALKSDDPELRRKILYNLGNAEYKKGDPDSALKQYEAALKIAPKDQEAIQNFEFVKKVIQEQKQKKKEQDPNNSDKKQEKKQGQQNQDQKNQKDTRENKDSDKENSKKENTEKDNNAQQSQPRDYADSIDPGAEPDPSSTQKQQKSQPAHEADKGHKDNEQTARMLNRLNDQPGRAMIPFYKNKTVEKDW